MRNKSKRQKIKTYFVLHLKFTPLDVPALQEAKVDSKTVAGVA